MYVEHVKQKASNTNNDPNSKFLNKEILRFKLLTTAKFDLRPLKTSIYGDFELKEALNVFNLVELWTVFKLTTHF